jgi:hypothetical protein
MKTAILTSVAMIGLLAFTASKSYADCIEGYSDKNCGKPTKSIISPSPVPVAPVPEKHAVISPSISPEHQAAITRHQEEERTKLKYNQEEQLKYLHQEEAHQAKLHQEEEHNSHKIVQCNATHHPKGCVKPHAVPISDEHHEAENSRN